MVDGSASTDDHLMLDGQSTDPSTDSHLLMSDQSPEGEDEHLHGSSSDKLQGSGEDAGHGPITFLQPAHLHLTPITPTKCVIYSTPLRRPQIWPSFPRSDNTMHCRPQSFPSLSPPSICTHNMSDLLHESHESSHLCHFPSHLPVTRSSKSQEIGSEQQVSYQEALAAQVAANGRRGGHYRG